MTRLPLKWNKTNLGWHDRLPEYELIKVQILANEHLSRRDTAVPQNLPPKGKVCNRKKGRLSSKRRVTLLKALQNRHRKAAFSSWFFFRYVTPRARSERTKWAVVMSEFAPICIYLVISPLVSLIPLGVPFPFASNSSYKLLIWSALYSIPSSGQE